MLTMDRVAVCGDDTTTILEFARLGWADDGGGIDSFSPPGASSSSSSSPSQEQRYPLLLTD
ncbi:hypothetical protein DAPPUDRAFT_235829 [Daphnia pulex]|uniref:Uncharacterized protein n=1 Tax=Daphnia pulex TaxID=6669 RepID=E9G0Z2_DAPPU|nr:hypothetical protein DAPPUDRAFT_235829 [Daphnia pulex]|eukprot:EFX87320.1 hypothetical protein DAPPUDRAFT_235829 [Daphnia pulex]